jgi:hypothetical protein
MWRASREVWMARVFLCYRRDDTAAISGRVYDRLAARFGRRNVFKDIDSIPLGVDFKQHIESVIRGCDGVIALIGRDWLTLHDVQGRSRLDDAEDFVRLEIETALATGLPLIPLLVDGARMPSATDLPASMVALALRNGMELEVGRHFEDDIRRLIAAVENWASVARPRLWGVRRNAPSTVLPQARPAAQVQAPVVSPPAPAEYPTKSKSSPRVRRTWVAPVGAVLLIVLALTLIAWPASPLRALAFGPRATATRPATSTPNGPTRARLAGIFVTNDGRDGWAVGSSNKMFRYGPASGWLPVPLPLDKSYALTAISMLPDASDGWAVGLNGAMLRYTRGQWTDQGSLTENLNAVQELAANDVWAAGDDGVIAHYNGAGWSVTHTSARANFNAISMVSSSLGWAAGYWSEGTAGIGDNSTYGLWRFDGTAWKPDRSGALGNEALRFTDVEMFSATDGVLAAMETASPGEGHLWRFQNNQWKAVQDTGFLYSIGSITLHLSMRSATDGFAIEGTYILQCKNGVWSEAGSPGPGGGAVILHGVHTISATEAWAVGESGVVIHEDSANPQWDQKNV